jgi:hypothetical protein
MCALRFWGRLRCEDEGRGEDLNSGPLSGEQFAGEVERKIDWKIERIDAGWSTISGVIRVHEDVSEFVEGMESAFRVTEVQTADESS